MLTPTVGGFPDPNPSEMQGLTEPDIHRRNSSMLEPGTLLEKRYKVIRLISKGGMGAVYEATDERLDSVVALKECFFDQPQLLRQFEREARLLARLRHQALTRVIDHFTEAGTAFLVMEFIPGEDLSEMMKAGQRFSPAQVLRWTDQLLDALEYLHAQEPPVIHRDIKPQNLKLTSRDQIILLDFGLAKGHVGDTTQVSAPRSVFGYTPNYAPLEQMQGTEGTDARSDLYSLAATVYHLLTGSPPPGPLARIGKITDRLPDPLQPVEQVNSDVPAEVGAALLKAMSLSRDGRQHNASELRAELSPFITQRSAITAPRTMPAVRVAPTAPPASVTETGKTQQATRRSRMPLATCLISILLIAAATVGGVFWLLKSMRKENSSAGAAGTTVTTNTEAHSLVASKVAASTAAVTAEALAQPLRILKGHTKSVRAVAFSPDGRLLASASWDGSARVWNVDDGNVVAVISRPDWTVNAVGFSRDGQMLAVGSYNSSGSEITFHAPRTGGSVRTMLRDPTNLISSLVFSPDGRHLIAAIGSRTRMWELESGKEVHVFEGNVNPSLALSADGNTVAIGTTNEKVVRLFDTRTGKPGRQFPEHSEGTLSLAFAPNGFVLAVGSYDGRITLWNFVTGEWIRSVVQPDLDAPFSVAFNPAATILAAGSYNEVRTWVSKTSVPIQTYDSGDAGTAYGVSFSPDGTLLAAGFDSGQIRLFRIE